MVNNVSSIALAHLPVEKAGSAREGADIPPPSPAFMEYQVKTCLHIPVGLHLYFPLLITQVSSESQL